jgi:dTDP-4-amino-4,6-dideoxygalactose transaminase
MAGLALTTPFEDGLGEHVYHQYTLLCDRRDDVLKALQQAGVGCAIYYPVPLHQQNVFKQDCAGLSLPVTQSVAANCLSLPICPFLEEKTIDTIVEVIQSVLRH